MLPDGTIWKGYRRTGLFSRFSCSHSVPDAEIENCGRIDALRAFYSTLRYPGDISWPFIVAFVGAENSLETIRRISLFILRLSLSRGSIVPFFVVVITRDRIAWGLAATIDGSIPLSCIWGLHPTLALRELRTFDPRSEYFIQEGHHKQAQLPFREPPRGTAHRFPKEYPCRTLPAVADKRPCLSDDF